MKVAHSRMKTRRSAENFIRSATAPVISAGVMIANLPWNITKTSSGIALSPKFRVCGRPVRPKSDGSQPISRRRLAPKASM